jgi:hypothetical protein
LISLSSSSQKFKFLKYSKNVSISTGKLCKEKRNQFNMARLSYNRVKSGANKNTMNIKAKEYRKTLNTSLCQY